MCMMVWYRMQLGNWMYSSTLHIMRQRAVTLSIYTITDNTVTLHQSERHRVRAQKRKNWGGKKMESANSFFFPSVYIFLFFFFFLKPLLFAPLFINLSSPTASASMPWWTEALSHIGVKRKHKHTRFHTREEGHPGRVTLHKVSFP